MSYLEAKTFDGGCVLSAASLEMDGRPGVVRDAVASVMQEWLDLLMHNVERAVAAGEIHAETDPFQLAFELNAVGMAANWQSQLFGDAFSYKTGRAGWSGLLESNKVSL